MAAVVHARRRGKTTRSFELRSYIIIVFTMALLMIRRHRYTIIVVIPSYMHRRNDMPKMRKIMRQ